jgi:hypothetical protein
MSENPLAVPQREKSGATTFGKYEYQYHWALYRIIDEHRANNEYALFIELHEDVVIADALDVSCAKFEFNQIKNISKPKYTIKSLTKRKGGKSSVLAKLIESSTGKPFSDKLSSINLVASCGFSFELKQEGLDFEVIRVGDLSEDSIKELKLALNNELGSDEIPPNLRFVVPKLRIESQQDLMIAKIAGLVDELFPGCHCSAVNIYRTLIDELHRKGGVAYDYAMWDDLLKNKAITSDEVKNAINTHTSVRDYSEIFNDFESITSEIGLKFLEKKELRRRVERLNIDRIGFPSSLFISIRNDVREALEKSGFCLSSDISSLLSEVCDSLGESTKKKIGSDLDVMARIIFEIITSEI